MAYISQTNKNNNQNQHFWHTGEWVKKEKRKKQKVFLRVSRSSPHTGFKNYFFGFHTLPLNFSSPCPSKRASLFWSVVGGFYRSLPLSLLSSPRVLFFSSAKLTSCGLHEVMYRTEDRTGQDTGHRAEDMTKGSIDEVCVLSRHWNPSQNAHTM